MSKNLPLSTSAELPLDELLEQLRNLIQQGRQQALRAVDTVQVRTCWEIGHYIVTFEQDGADRAGMAANFCRA